MFVDPQGYYQLELFSHANLKVALSGFQAFASFDENSLLLPRDAKPKKSYSRNPDKVQGQCIPLQ
jgi:hypothetical protein